jgi:hypothetical protein
MPIGLNRILRNKLLNNREFLVDSFVQNFSIRVIHNLQTLRKALNRQLITYIKRLIFRIKNDLNTIFSKLVITKKF